MMTQQVSQTAPHREKRRFTVEGTGDQWEDSIKEASPEQHFLTPGLSTGVHMLHPFSPF